MNLEHQAAYEPTGYYATRLNPILMDLPISWPSIDSFGVVGVVVAAVAAALFAFVFFEDGYEMVGIHWGVQEQIRAQLIMARYLKIHIIHPLKSNHLDILTQTHTTFFDPLGHRFCV